MHILVTRPKPFASETADFLRAQGHTVTVEPLFEVTYHPILWNAIPYDGLVVTSRQAMLVPGIEAFRDLPLWAVGDSTHFPTHETVHVFPDVQTLQANMPRDLSWLYVRGKEITQALTLPYVDEHVGYTMLSITAWPQHVLDVWQSIDAVMLMSQATARTFMAITAPDCICHMKALCYSQNIADIVASYPWQVEIAKKYNF